MDWFPIGQRCAWERPFGASRSVVMRQWSRIERPQASPAAYDTAYSQPDGKHRTLRPGGVRAPSIQCRDVFEQIEDVGPLTAGTASCSTAGARMMLDRNAFTREVARIVPNSLEGELLLLAARADAKRVEAQRHWQSTRARPVSLRDQLAERGAELNGSSAASYRRNRAMVAQYKCGKTTTSDESVRSFVRAIVHAESDRLEDEHQSDEGLARWSHASGQYRAAAVQKVTPGSHQFCA